MGRAPGSKNGAGKKAAAKKAPAKKAAAAAAPSTPKEAPRMEPGPSNGPTAVEKQQYLELYRKHRRTLAKIMEEAADERGNGRSLLKQFENKGGNIDKLKAMWELTNLTKAEAQADVAQYLEYVVDIGIRVSFDGRGQGSLDDVLEPTTEATEATDRARAYEEGWQKAKDGGQVTDNPKTAGSAEHQQWHKGFSDRIWEQENGGAAPTVGAAA